jgi:sugar lactone lactonase YvrE
MAYSRLSVMVAAVGVVMALSGGRTAAQGPNAYPNPYGPEDANHFKLPGGRMMGSTVGVDIDPDGRSVWIYERCGANRQTATGAVDPTAARRNTRRECETSDVAPILKFDAAGDLVTSFGAKLIVHPHGLHVDRDGNVWVTDGEQGADTSRGNQVHKFSPEGKPLLTLGRAGGGDGLTGPDFNQPSSIVTAPNGDIFVGDGHGSTARIVKFSKDGTFIKAWSRKGTGPGELDLPHALAMDSTGRLFVGDRGNSRIVIFNQEGNLLDEWKQFGRPSGLFIDMNDTLYCADSTSNDEVNPGFQKGIRIGSAKDGKVITFIPDPDPEGSQEGVAVDAEGNVYGALSNKQAVKRYSKKS